MPYNFIPENLSALEFLQRQVIPKITPNSGPEIPTGTKEYFGQTIISHINQILSDRGYLAIEEIENIFSNLSSSCRNLKDLEKSVTATPSGFIVDGKKISHLNNFFKICAGSQSLSKLLTSIAPKSADGDAFKQEISTNPSFELAVHQFSKETLKISCESLFRSAIAAYIAGEIEQGDATPGLERILALSAIVEKRIASGGYFFSPSQELLVSGSKEHEEGRGSASSRDSDSEAPKLASDVLLESALTEEPKPITAKTFMSRGARSALGTLTNSTMPSSAAAPSPIAYKPKAAPAKIKREDATANVDGELSSGSREAKAPKLAQRF